MNYKTCFNVDENTAKELEILRMKSNSLYNLFVSFMNDKFEIYNDVKIKDFMEEYSDLRLVLDSMMNGLILNAIGKDKYKDYVSPCINKCVSFDYPNREITITWNCPNNNNKE